MLPSNPKTILVVGGSENQLGNYLQEVFRHALFRYFNWSMRQLQTCQQALAFLRQNPLPWSSPGTKCLTATGKICYVNFVY
jgi:hypothetical protein